MELIKLIKVIKKNLILILILGMIAGFSTLFFARLRPLTYNTFFAITISQAGIDPTSDYKYDNYYSQQAIEVFTDSFEKWFSDPQLITKAFEKAEIDIGDISPRKRSKLIKARKLGSQHIEVSFESRNPQEGEKIFKGLLDIINSKLESLRGERQVWFKVNAGKPLITKKEWNLFLLTTVSFLAGALIGVFFALLKYYWEKGKK